MDAAAHMPSGWLAILWGIITFSLLVVVHEGGHFLAARLFKVKVHEFMIGLPGPALRFRAKRSGTSYGITAIPLGGYVRIAGMEPGPEDELLGPALEHIVATGSTTVSDLASHLAVDRERAQGLLISLAEWAAISNVPDSDTYRAVGAAAEQSDPSGALERARAVTYRGKPTWQRISILSAGVAFNLVTAFLIFMITFTGWGFVVPSLRAESVVPSGPAATAGIRAGDRIVALDGKTLADWDALLASLAERDPGDRVKVTVLRDSNERTFDVQLGEIEGRARLGVESRLERQRLGPLEAASESLSWMAMVFVAIGEFFNPRTFATSIEGARSVIGISYEVARAAEAGPIQYAWMIAFLSLSLGAMNILPLPPLDGGKIVVEIVERIRRRPLRREFSYSVSAVGALLLFSLIIYLMYADVMRYIIKG